MEKRKQGNGIQSIERAFRILELFDLRHDELSITEISQLTDLPISTVHRFLMTLEGLGYIRQNAENGRYRLGMQAFILGTRVKTLEEIRSAARVHIRELHKKYNETVHLVIEQNAEVLCVDKFDADRRLTYTPGVGETNKLYATSVGKCIMAFQYDEKTLASVLSRMRLTPLTQYTITERARLLEEVKAVRAQGYALDDQESETGLICFGAPVFGPGNRCVAAISMSIPEPRLIYDRAQIIADVKAAAADISLSLGAVLLHA